MEICRLTVITHFLAQTDKGVSRHKIWLLTANRIRFICNNHFVQTRFRSSHFVQTTADPHLHMYESGRITSDRAAELV